MIRHDDKPAAAVRERRRRWAIRIARKFGIVGLAAQLIWIAAITMDPGRIGGDAVQIWAQAERIRSEQPLYSPMLGYGPHMMTGTNEYPLLTHSPYLPPLAALAALAPRTTLPRFAWLQTVMVVILFWVYAAVLARLAVGKWTVDSWLVANGVLIATPGATIMMVKGNIEPLMWTLFGAAFLISRRGVPLALMAGVKIHAAWPLLFVAVRAPWRTAREIAPTVAILTGIVVAAMGVADSAAAIRAWFQHILPALGQGTFAATNISLSFLPLRIAKWLGWEYVSGPLPPIARVWLIAAGILAPLICGWATRRKPVELQAGAVMAAALLWSPMCWAGYLPSLFAPAAWAAGSMRATSEPERFTDRNDPPDAWPREVRSVHGADPS
jgi:hypothetical protein